MEFSGFPSFVAVKIFDLGLGFPDALPIAFEHGLDPIRVFFFPFFEPKAIMEITFQSYLLVLNNVLMV